MLRLTAPIAARVHRTPWLGTSKPIRHKPIEAHAALPLPNAASSLLGQLDNDHGIGRTALLDSVAETFALQVTPAAVDADGARDGDLADRPLSSATALPSIKHAT